MAVAKPLIFDGNINRLISQGDVLAGAEILAVNTTVGASTVTAAQLVSGILNRTGSGAGFNETTDTATNIIAALIGTGLYNVTPVTGISSGAAVQPGTTVRLRYLNQVAFAATFVAGTGVTLVGNTVVAASSFKDFLLTVINGTPAQLFAAIQTNASAVITGLSLFQTSQLSVGMIASGANIQAGSTIVSVQTGIGVTLSLPVTATLTLNAITFIPSVSITAIGGGLL